MRAREIILELREYLDRSNYGCWIDSTTGNIEYVKEFGHVQAILVKYNPEKMYSDDAVYNYAFGNHLVRVVTDPDNMINISGTAEDLRKVSQILLASCAQPEIISVSVDKYDISKNELTIESSNHFDMPRERRDLMLYIKGETE